VQYVACVLRRPALLVLALIPALGIGASALAQGGGGEDLEISMHKGCLHGTFVTVKIVPPEGKMLSPVRVRAEGREVVRLSNVTQEVSVRVRLPEHQGRIAVSGEQTGGRQFDVSYDYRQCAPAAPPTPTPAPQRRARPEPTLSGGGEG
jgi:hypothetical protein